MGFRISTQAKKVPLTCKTLLINGGTSAGKHCKVAKKILVAKLRSITAITILKP
jgi:hypothetical protein